MTPKVLKQTLEQALKDSNPAEYRRLAQVPARLQKFLQDLMAEYEAAVSEAQQALLNKYASLDSPEKVQEMNSAMAEIEEAALNQLFERITELRLAS